MIANTARLPRLFLTATAVLLLALVASALLASAQGGELAITRSAVYGGGATAMMGDAFTLSGTMAQPFAASIAGADYDLSSGFWDATPSYPTFLPWQVYVSP